MNSTAQTSEAPAASGRLGQHLPSPAYSSCVRNPLPCAKLPSTPCACALIRRFAHHFLAALALLWSVPARSVAFCVSVAAGFPPCLCRNRGLSIRCSEVCLRRCIALGSVEDFVEAVRRAYADLQGLLHFFRTSVLIVLIL